MTKLPADFLNSLKSCDLPDPEGFVAVHDSTELLTSIRLNPFKKAEPHFEYKGRVPWNSSGYYLEERPSFTQDPLFHAGCYYVQEAGSMFLEQALQQSLNLSASLKVLDVSAAPGGKSTLINSLLNAESLLVANEPIKSRADVLAQNLSRWGTTNCIVTNNYPERFSTLQNFFDALVLDAPCSGSGLFRKQPEAVEEWSMDAVQSCSLRQQSILKEVLPALKENGILIYSTCSYSVEENEDIVKWLVEMHDMEYVPLQIKADWGITATEYGYRFYPHLTKSEGFFCAVMRKKTAGKTSFRPAHKTNPTQKHELHLLQEFVHDKELILQKVKERFHLMNESVLDFLNRFEKQFYFKKAGTLVGEIKGGKLVPEQEVAWSVYLKESVKRIDLDKASALLYLKKENFPKGNFETGLALISYKNFGLGWAKVMENRINNYLPSELRILK